MRKLSLLFSLLLCVTLTAQDKQLSLEDIWASGKFRSQGISGILPANNGSNYTAITMGDEGPEIATFSYKTQKKIGTVITQTQARYEGENLSLYGYEFSKDEKKLILGKDVESIYRRSSKGHYFVVDVASKEIKPISDAEKGKISHPTFSPNGKKIAFVRTNNLYIVDLNTGEESQITTDGEWNKVINGMCDWVYEEEFSFTKAFFWSPDNQYLAFYRFNEEQVPTYTMRYYKALYPELYSFKYPKAGEKNAIVSIHIYNTVDKQMVDAKIGEEQDQYIPRLKWIPGINRLCAYRMNRLQNKLELLNIDPSTGDSRVFYKEESATYVEVTDDLLFTEDGQRFYITSEKEGYNQIYAYHTSGKPISKLTTDKWDVTSVYGLDNSGYIYFQAAAIKPYQREIYKMSTRSKKLIRLTPENGYSTADFSSDFSYMIHHYRSANQPEKVFLKNNKGRNIKLLEGNEDLANKLAEYNLSPKEFFTFTTERKQELYGYMIKPENFDENKEYPVFMTCYNGPGINRVNDYWEGANQLWLQYLAQEGYLVVCVDGRGTGYRGADFKKCTYKQLGKLETEDQISAAKWVGKLPYADANRISMQGWSYGGYMTLLCLTKGADVFAAGISVAPVTNWRFYDTIYTERYMALPQENGKGYDDNSPLSHAEKLEDPLLLVHGSGDDNVHVQNTFEMVEALVQANKDFDQFIYPNKNHGIYGGNTRLHLFSKMEKFLKENL
ncbi:S9 family peptidase [Luteibaculum oceani]|uniref:S9 family peptidase n=1 Tax=Luteibaculum oceani TaxID=1294296 RepID=A0A5C6V826_9FLAO|nr:S9 family peptidase [Luteibaculum oceani]TXC81453.1 S9 family peptidase [Luteibaculum oceani]